MTSPFERKNKLATLLDRLAIHLLLFALCVLYFYAIWRILPASLLAGSAAYVLLMLTLSLLERRTLERRDRHLRERIGGAIALSELVLMPASSASAQVCALLCEALHGKRLADAAMQCDGKRYLVRCAQCLRGSSASEGDVLAAHRARIEAQMDACVLVSTGSFTPAAVRASEWVDPPVRLISAAQLSALYGRLHPATDEEIARHAQRERTPFSFARMKTLALSPLKLRRYLLCAFLLLVMYLLTGSLMCLASCLLAFVLAILTHRENHRGFRL